MVCCTFLSSPLFSSAYRISSRKTQELQLSAPFDGAVRLLSNVEIHSVKKKIQSDNVEGKQLDVLVKKYCSPYVCTRILSAE